jgi:SAM-dependent methyltransferase
MKDEQSGAELLKIADGRLHPSITNPNYLVLRRRVQIFARWLQNIPGDCMAVLDVGGRYQPYRPLIEKRSRRYLAVDIDSSPLIDVVGSGEQIPFSADTFDLVVATGVFEFFSGPHAAAAEVHRVLKSGGHMLMSVAAIAPRARDEEHWRYLPAGLRSVLSPFSRVEIVPEVTSVGGILRLNACALSMFSKYEFVRKIVHRTLVPVVNLLGLALEGAGLTHNDQLAGNYSVLAQK